MNGREHYSMSPSIWAVYEVSILGLNASKALTRPSVPSPLSVVPKRQKGLGTPLMRPCLEMAEQTRLPIFSTAFPSAMDLYLKFVFWSVGQFDTDLSEWAGKYRGYGDFRSPAEVREVGKGT